MPDEWNEATVQILEKIAALAQAESQHILVELQDTPGFSESTPRQQAKAYAAAVGSKLPWSALLHQARNGDIDLNAARRLFKGHAEAQDLLNSLSQANE